MRGPRKQIAKRGWEVAFLARLAMGDSPSVAAAIAGIDRTTAYARRLTDPPFLEAWLDAFEQGTDLLEQQAYNRAHTGWLEPVYQGGRLVGYVRKFDNTVLLKLLAARRPGVYREQREVHHTGGGRPVTAGDLEAIARAGRRPELADAFDVLAEALGREVRGEAPAASSTAPAG